MAVVKERLCGENKEFTGLRIQGKGGVRIQCAARPTHGSSMAGAPSSVDATGTFVPGPVKLRLLAEKEWVNEGRWGGEVSDVDPEADGG